MFVHSFSAVITGMLLAAPIVPCGNILTQDQAAQPADLSSPFLYKRYRNLTLRSAQKLQKQDLLFQFCVRAASVCWCNCRSPLPVVDLALITSPMGLFLPRPGSSNLAQRIQGISPSVLGVSVPTQMATQAPCISNTLLDHITGSDITVCSGAGMMVSRVLSKRKEVTENLRFCSLQLYFYDHWKFHIFERQSPRPSKRRT